MLQVQNSQDSGRFIRAPLFCIHQFVSALDLPCQWLVSCASHRCPRVSRKGHAWRISFPFCRWKMDPIEISNYLGLAALTLLTANISLGLLLSIKYNPVRRWPHRKINTLKLHNWTGYVALGVALLHPLLILLSKTAHFRLIDVFYPLNAPKQALVNTIGALALYGVAFVVITSYFRFQIGRSRWKAMHFSAFGAAVLFIVHGLLTDPNLKDTPFNPLDAEKLYVEFCGLVILVGIALRTRWQLKQPPPRPHRAKAPRKSVAQGSQVLSVIIAALALLAMSSSQLFAQQLRGWSYNPDVGFIYQRGDFRWASWGFAERYWGPHSEVVSADAWRRVRQGMELDFPLLTKSLRPAAVYEVDLTDNNFFRAGRSSQVFENLYVALENREDESRFRVIAGENTHILSREDNLSSGNLPTINRALVLEEHGSVNSFGTQWGLQLRRAFGPYSVALSAQDNRGSLNTGTPKFHIGNSLATKVTATMLNDTINQRHLSIGVGADYTRGITDRMFTLASAIGAEALGGTQATGNKLSLEADAVYGGFFGGHAYTVESETLFSDFSRSLTDVAGGYVQLQVSGFDSERAGDFDPFVRYDIVRLDRERGTGAAVQHALRTGVNFNLPVTHKLASLHLEYALNRLRGPVDIVPVARSFGEFRIELRFSAIRYLRH